MPYPARARTGLKGPKGSTDDVNSIDDTLKDDFDHLEAVMALVSQGVLASRPTSSSGSPGITGRQYFATDTRELFYDYGTGWVKIGGARAEGSFTVVNTYTGGGDVIILSTRLAHGLGVVPKACGIHVFRGSDLVGYGTMKSTTDDTWLYFATSTLALGDVLKWWASA